MMVQRYRLDRHHCVPAVVAAKVEARGRWICLRGSERRVRDHRMVVVRLELPYDGKSSDLSVAHRVKISVAVRND